MMALGDIARSPVLIPRSSWALSPTVDAVYFAAIAKKDPPAVWPFNRFYREVTSPNSGLGAFRSGDVRDISCYKGGVCEYLLMRVHIHNEKIPVVWVRAERPPIGPDTIKFSADRSKLWDPEDNDIMASAFATLSFRHVLDLLGIVHTVTMISRLDPMWYAGIIIGILHGGFGKLWVNPPPPDWIKIALNLFGSDALDATQSVEHQFAIQHPSTKKISLMEPEAWDNEPTPLSQPPSSEQDDLEAVDSNAAGTNDNISHIALAPTSAVGDLRAPRPLQSPHVNSVVPVNGTDAKKNAGRQRRGRKMKIRTAPGIDRSNVLASKALESLRPYDPDRRSRSRSRSPLSDQSDEKRSMQPPSAPLTPTPPTRISPKEDSTGIDEATAILQHVVIMVPSAEAFGQGPQAIPSFTDPQPEPLETPDLTGRILRLGSTPIATGGYSSVWRGSLLSDASDDLQVAIKLLRASHTDEDTLERKLQKRLRVEMRVWAQLRHENVVRLLGRSDEPEGPGLVSMFYPYGNVLSFLAKNPGVNREVICADVALGLQYLHELNPPIIHGDLKGPNVLIDGEGRASICDFGLSIILDGGPTGHTTSNFGGSLRFLAPELLDESARTVETDIYAYACTCIEILFDQEPYHELSKEVHIMSAIWSHRPPIEPSNGEVTFPSFLRILKRCWNHNSASRPPLNLITDTIQRCLYRTYRTNLVIHRGIGKRVRFMCLPGIEEVKLISVTDSGLSIIVDASSSFHRVPIYQRYRWELMDRQDLEDSEGGSDVSWTHETDHEYSPSVFSPVSGKSASLSESPPYVSKWKEYSAIFRLPYSSLVSYEPYNEVIS